MKKLILLFSILAPMYAYAMDSVENSIIRPDIAQIKHAKFLQRVRNGDYLLFINISPAMLTHALYIACLSNQRLSVERIINHCIREKITITSGYANLGLLIAHVYENDDIVKLLNAAKIIHPMDIHYALEFAVDKDEMELFFVLTDANYPIDSTNPHAQAAMNKAVLKRYQYMIIRLFKIGIPLENAKQNHFILKHPRINEIKAETKKIQHSCKK